jgi:hypothetical protein
VQNGASDMTQIESGGDWRESWYGLSGGENGATYSENSFFPESAAFVELSTNWLAEILTAW